MTRAGFLAIAGVFWGMGTSTMGRAQTADLGATPTDQVQTEFEAASKLAPEAKVARAAEYITRMKEILKRDFELLEGARGEKDIVKLNCINEKLTSLKGLLKISEQADINLQEAVARKDSEAADHEFTKIAIAYQKATVLGVESETCVGEALHYAGKTQVEYVIDPSIPAEDPTRVLSPTPILDQRPPAASPFQ